MKHLSFVLLFAGLCLQAVPQISPWNGAPIQLDGKLDEVGWKAATVYSDFVPTTASGKAKAEVATSFRICQDAKYLYVGVECQEPRMKDLDMKGGIWISDGVEFFFCPSGKNDDFYQFRVNANGPTYTMFYGECGVTRPDPYAPIWEHAVNLRQDGWSIEMRIPWQAFYMTSARAWNSTWLLNVARNRRLARQDSSWAPLRDSFLESKYYRPMAGFPAKKPTDDLYIKSADIQVKQFANGRYTGPLTVEITADKAGEYILSCEKKGLFSQQSQIKLNPGLNQVVMPNVFFTATGRNEVYLQLRKKKQVAAERFYAVPVAYSPIQVRLTSPCYRNTFYPGQKSEVISGVITVSDTSISKVSLQLDKNAPVLLQLKNGQVPFTLPCPNLTDGKHQLTLSLPNQQTIQKTITIQKFSQAPAGRTSAWIENGWLIVNGKPVLPRLIYAQYYHGGKALDAKVDKDDLGLTAPDRNIRRVIEPKRLIADIEFREATKDVKPCQQMYDKMRKTVERLRDQDFTFYYFSDEPECREVSPVYLKYMYEFVKELDPWHPMQISTRAPARYLDCADILVTHPYSGPTFDGKGGRFLTVPVQRVRDYAKEVNNAQRPDKVAGMMNQFFSYKMNSVFADYPTFEELEAQTWSSLANNVHFFYPYAYHDIGDRPVLYEGLRYLMTSLRSLEPITLLGTCRTLSNSKPAETDCALLTNNGKSLFLVVNLMPKATTVTVQDAELAKVPTWYRFREKAAPVAGGKSSMTFNLAPYQSLLLTSVPIGTELPTRKETIATIAKLEIERLSRPNLLVNQGPRIEINCSNMPRTIVGMQNKLFDGTRDTLAWDNAATRRQPAFMELSFTKGLIPQFRKLRIYGTPLHKETVVSIRKRGEWLQLTPASVKQSEYMVEFTYDQPQKTIRLRLDFPKKSQDEILELYEIELEP